MQGKSKLTPHIFSVERSEQVARQKPVLLWQNKIGRKRRNRHINTIQGLVMHFSKSIWKNMIRSFFGAWRDDIGVMKPGAPRGQSCIGQLGRDNDVCDWALSPGRQPTISHVSRKQPRVVKEEDSASFMGSQDFREQPVCQFRLVYIGRIFGWGNAKKKAGVISPSPHARPPPSISKTSIHKWLWRIICSIHLGPTWSGSGFRRLYLLPSYLHRNNETDSIRPIAGIGCW